MTRESGAVYISRAEGTEHISSTQSLICLGSCIWRAARAVRPHATVIDCAQARPCEEERAFYVFMRVFRTIVAGRSNESDRRCWCTNSRVAFDVLVFFFTPFSPTDRGMEAARQFSVSGGMDGWRGGGGAQRNFCASEFWAWMFNGGFSDAPVYTMRERFNQTATKACAFRAARNESVCFRALASRSCICPFFFGTHVSLTECCALY